MSRPSVPKPVKLVMSILAGRRELLSEALESVSDRFGKIDFLSRFLLFGYTDYYRDEMGEGLDRRIASFEELIAPEALPDIKLFTNDVEDRLSVSGKRQVNIDPGYLTEFHLILATGKGYAHRPYLRGGIYADLTLLYRDKAFRPLEWTYPDYAGDEIRSVLSRIRLKYIQQLKFKAAQERA